MGGRMCVRNVGSREKVALSYAKFFCPEILLPRIVRKAVLRAEESDAEELRPITQTNSLPTFLKHTLQRRNSNVVFDSA